ncbi:hypothetical protein MTR67_019906 [Solanum verrucosum]|uniref:Uncharacterized protein n=1 Tax=Solanum verrucosum TaxID=315347 RepID=A0AAF0QNG5_SOLVR|nr:hypothetical protein MTR67_019906 [Solanum verrucosum]
MDGYHSSIQMAPYEAFYGKRCRSPIGWFEVGKSGLVGPDLVHQAMDKVKVIQVSRLEPTPWAGLALQNYCWPLMSPQIGLI